MQKISTAPGVESHPFRGARRRHTPKGSGAADAPRRCGTLGTLDAAPRTGDRGQAPPLPSQGGGKASGRQRARRGRFTDAAARRPPAGQGTRQRRPGDAPGNSRRTSRSRRRARPDVSDDTGSWSKIGEPPVFPARGYDQ
jgi:hypothetical protein